MTTTDPELRARVLAIGAHPDDVEFGCGATLAKWARAASHVELLVLTDGSKGTWEADRDLASLVTTRRDEQRAAAHALGAREVHFLDAVDGELEADALRREQVCGVIRAVRPDVVLGHDPWKQYRLHPDHRRAGELVIEGIVAARDPHFFPSAGRPHRPERLLLFEAQEIDHIEAVTEQDVEAKIQALLCHKSQWRSTMGIDTDAAQAKEQRAAFEARVREEITEAGGESFKLITEL
ncbi:MAG TPA: PIG-L deacetylase family protein [Acidimicrobiia bacterium]|nr:PIG-L deacetylase family protein [Acidimicrobiia bacterium]